VPRRTQEDAGRERREARPAELVAQVAPRGGPQAFVRDQRLPLAVPGIERHVVHAVEGVGEARRARGRDAVAAAPAERLGFEPAVARDAEHAGAAPRAR
jgi:hypothetical protein